MALVDISRIERRRVGVLVAHSSAAMIIAAPPESSHVEEPLLGLFQCSPRLLQFDATVFVLIQAQ